MISEYFPNGLERYLIGGLLIGLGWGHWRHLPRPGAGRTGGRQYDLLIALASIFAGAGPHGLWVGRLCKKAA